MKIVLKPRFTEGNFDGFDQVSGDTFDACGFTYEFEFTGKIEEVDTCTPGFCECDCGNHNEKS